MLTIDIEQTFDFFNHAFQFDKNSIDWINVLHKNKKALSWMGVPQWATSRLVEVHAKETQYVPTCSYL